MHALAIVLSLLLALVALAAGLPKLAMVGAGPNGLPEHFGLSTGLVRFTGGAETAAGLGLLVGLVWHPLGLAAATGLAVLLLGAIVLHARAGDYTSDTWRGPAFAASLLCPLAVLASYAISRS